ncbi:MAG: heavy metal translocating P-type ATPase [Clostridia bacterium]|nr:heavy metal translocating P-type ATPase [Clostridia bacterium]
MVKTYSVTGMTCSACSSGIERTVSKMEGVSNAEVSLMAKSMKVDFDDNVVSEESIFQAVRSLGYGIYREGEQPVEKKMPHDKKLFIRFIVSVCLLVPLMYVSMGHMFGAPLPFFLNPEKGYAQWFCLYQVILSAAIIGVNAAYFKNGFMAVIHRVPNMDTLVALGSGVSFLYSFVMTVLVFVGSYNGNTEWVELHMSLYFESAAMILTLVDIGKWLEEKSKRKTGEEVEKLLRLAPDRVTVEEDGIQKEISIKDVKAGDILVVKQGEYIPADGVIVYGSSFVDKSAITGESLPVEVAEGDLVTSAALNKSGIIKIRAEKVGEDTTLSKIVKMVKEAGASKAPIQKFADKVAGVFVPVVVAIAILTFLVWILIDGGFVASHCVTYAISVLVVSCPCALGLATPVAIMTATGKGASLGILYKDAESLQKVCDINSVLLDKTATLTEGKPRVTDIITFGVSRNEVLKLACGIEKNSNHPLAKCIVDYAADGYDVQNFEYIVGKGAKADYNGKSYALGNERLTGKINEVTRKAALNLSSQGKTVMYLSCGKDVIALIAVADTLKEGSKEAVSLLKERKIRVAMLTGDEKNTAQAIAAEVGIDDYLSEVMPEDKLNAVTNLQQVGGFVAMVGDGINDSPALKQADVGIAMGTGTDVAIDSADVVLVRENLRTLDDMFELSRATVRNIKENLFWAFFYNIIMIPVAAGVFSFCGITFGTYGPMIAAACMSLSSLFVVCNALRLLRFKNKRNKEINKEGDFMKTIVTVEGMSCEHCAKRVENAISAVEGVEGCEVKLKKKVAIIKSSNPVSEEAVTKAVTDAGYEVKSVEVK